MILEVQLSEYRFEYCAENIKAEFRIRIKVYGAMLNLNLIHKASGVKPMFLSVYVRQVVNVYAGI